VTTEPITDDAVEEDAGGGYFTDAARRAVLAAVLPTLSSYFATSAALTAAPVGVARDAGDSWQSELSCGLRLRVGLAATRTLSRVVQAVSAQPTFRYQQFRREEFDLSHGALDVTACLTTAALTDSPRRYPVATVERTHLTPENVLLAHAVRWLLRELSSLLRAVGSDGAFVLPRNSEDYRAGQRAARYLTRVLREPFLRSVAPRAAAASFRESDVDQP